MHFSVRLHSTYKIFSKIQYNRIKKQLDLDEELGELPRKLQTLEEQIINLVYV